MTIELFGTKVNTRYLFHVRRYVLYTIMLVLFSVFLITFVIIPQGQAVLERYQRYQRQEEQLAAMQQKLQQLQALPMSELFASSSLVHELLPSRKPLLELLSALNEAASRSGIQYRNVSLSPGLVATPGADLTDQSSTGTVNRGRSSGGSSARVARGVETLNVNVTVIGVLSSINQFLNDIERMAPIATVTRLNLTERGGTASLDQDGFFEADLQVQTYFFTQPISTTLAAPVPIVGSTQQAILNEIRSYIYPQVQTLDVIQGGVSDPFGVLGPAQRF